MADLLFSIWADRRLMVMLGAYLDESGTSRDSGVLVVGGYIADARPWKRFQANWREILLRAGMDPRVEPFHMAPFEARKQPHMKGKTPFSEWSDAKADAVLRALIETIRETVLVGVMTALVVDDYEQITAQMTNPATRYYFCILRCIAQARQWLEDNRLAAHDIAYVFEDGADNRNEIDQALAYIFADQARRAAFRLTGLEKKSKLDFMQLQGADIGVWETRRYAINRRLRGAPSGLRASLQTLLEIPHYAEYWDKKHLINYAVAISADRGPGYRSGAEDD